MRCAHQYRTYNIWNLFIALRNKCSKEKTPLSWLNMQIRLTLKGVESRKCQNCQIPNIQSVLQQFARLWLAPSTFLEGFD